MRYKRGKHGAVDITLLFELGPACPWDELQQRTSALRGLRFGGKRAYFECYLTAGFKIEACALDASSKPSQATQAKPSSLLLCWRNNLY